ncbi:capsular exopolysaccharide synthesis family protein [Novosphingobium sp. SG751A]|uniref:GumC family protein n=1 Tax=Novosphingobium sp. SG751A TaxID=2587000 RepID=UPI0015550806|nr:polysaccharide biosynthesis tyrosine autokinase [Novosphingobium sp. SG751A]NOW45586.1 capsular exopolysaccharide synthesis family protein [Novosphingobium sp. SG751A]
MDQENPLAPSGGGLNFRYIYAVLRANLVLVVSLFFGSLLISILVTLLQTPLYIARSTVQINNSTSRVLSKDNDEGQGEDASAMQDTDRYLKTQMEILKSRSLALRVADALKLVDNPAFYEAMRTKPNPAGVARTQASLRAAGLLIKGLDVTIPRDSRIATISFESADPALSAKIANAYASEFIQSSLQRKFESSGYAREFLARQLVEVKDKFEQSERALNGYARSAGLIRSSSDVGGGTQGAGSGPSVIGASLNQFNQSANEAKTRRIAAESRWRAINSGPLLNATEVVTNAAVSNLLTQRATALAALEEERARHLDGYPTVAAKQAQLQALNSQIQTLANNVRNAIKSEYEAAIKAETELSGQVDRLKADTLNEQDRTVQYNLLQHEVQTNRELYDGLLQRYKELNASAGISTSNISVIDTAQAPGRPSSPDILKNLLYGFAGSLVLTAMVLFIKEQFDDSVRIPEDVETKLAIPLLGVVPVSSSNNPVLELDDPKSQISEAYNSLRGSLLFATQHGLPRLFMITSAQPAEGKSTSSYATALTLARMKKKVLLIDADLRRPSQHRLIDYDNTKGLSDVLTSQSSMADLAQPTDQPGLFMLTSGPIPPSPTEMLSSMRMREALEEAKKDFDVILIDSPPVLGLADAPMIAAIVEGVVFIVESDRSRHGSLKTSLRRLRAVRSNILGGVLTKFDPLKSGSRYSSYYGYEYYQYQYGYSVGNDRDKKR